MKYLLLEPSLKMEIMSPIVHIHRKSYLICYLDTQYKVVNYVPPYFKFVLFLCRLDFFHSGQ